MTGKYAIPHGETLTWKMEERNLLRIANELAEANRLKRLEMRHFVAIKTPVVSLQQIPSFLKEELEDQA